MSRISMDRRAFLEGMGMAAAVCAVPVTWAGAKAAQVAPRPRMALHLDYPYYDKWGTGAPYEPPSTWGEQAALQPHEDYGRYFSYV